MKGLGNLSFRDSKGPFIKIFRTHIPYNWKVYERYTNERYTNGVSFLPKMV